VLAGPFEGTQNQGSGGAENDDLVFFTTADSPNHPDGNGEIKMVELTLQQQQGAGEMDLVRKVTSNITTEQQPLQEDSEIICRNVKSLTFQYYDGSEWDTTWDSTLEDNTIPAAVQVTMSFERVQGNGEKKEFKFTRIFQLSASTAMQDSNVNPNVGSTGAQ
jgi:hypothetical protein